MSHTHSLTSLFTLIASVAMAMAIIALQPQPRVEPAAEPAPAVSTALGASQELISERFQLCAAAEARTRAAAGRAAIGRSAARPAGEVPCALIGSRS